MDTNATEYWVTDGKTDGNGYYNSYGKGNDHKPYRTYKSALIKATKFNNHSIRRGRPERYFVATWISGNLVEVKK